MDLRPVALGAPVTAYDPSRPTPAAIVSGEVAAHDAPHPLSVFDMFRIGIGPSSSHTVGPMRAGLAFTTELTALTPPSHITIDLFGSLGATGRGHSTDRAVLLGLAGYDPETVDIDTVEAILPTLARTGTLTLPSGTRIPLNIAEDIRFVPRTVLPYHVNALTLTATGQDGDVILQRTYYSVGGGFVMLQTNDDPQNPEVSSLASSQAGVGIDIPAPHPFASAAQLLAQCDEAGLSIADLVRTNEEAVRPRDTLNAYLDRIADTMFDCVDAGTSAAGILPGGLDVPRRARALAGKLAQRLTGIPASPVESMDEAGADSSARRAAGAAWASTTADPMRAMDWVNLFALAVNEENAAGHRVVTAPTNGAAGVIPAVLGYLVTHCPETGSVPGVAAGPATEDGAVQPLRHIRMTPSPSADSLAGCTDSGDEATASSVDRSDESPEVAAARAEGLPVLGRDEAGLRTLAQILGQDTPLVARSELGLPADLVLAASGAVSGAGLTYPSLDTLLTARGLGHLDAWGQVRIGDRLGPTLAEALDEVNREIVREYAQAPRGHRSAKH